MKIPLPTCCAICKKPILFGRVCKVLYCQFWAEKRRLL